MDSNLSGAVEDMADQMAEIGELIVREEAVLEKFEGEVEDGILVERITFVNGDLTKHEFFENGEVVKTEHFTEGGEEDSTN